MKRLIFCSLAILATSSVCSAYAKPFELTQQEISALNESGVEPPASSPPVNCEALKPKEQSADVGFNAMPCTRPGKINPNPVTRESAKYACGKHSGLWEAFCACSGKKLKSLPEYVGDIEIIDCKRNPNSKVNCGIFVCE